MAQLTVNSTLTSLKDTLSILAILECGSYDTINRYMSQFNVCAHQVSPNRSQVFSDSHVIGEGLCHD